MAREFRTFPTIFHWNWGKSIKSKQTLKTKQQNAASYYFPYLVSMNVSVFTIFVWTPFPRLPTSRTILSMKCANCLNYLWDQLDPSLTGSGSLVHIPREVENTRVQLLGEHRNSPPCYHRDLEPSIHARLWMGGISEVSSYKPWLGGVLFDMRIFHGYSIFFFFLINLPVCLERTRTLGNVGIFMLTQIVRLILKNYLMRVRSLLIKYLRKLNKGG